MLIHLDENIIVTARGKRKYRRGIYCRVEKGRLDQFDGTNIW